jgi:uncharacterized membrane protein
VPTLRWQPIATTLLCICGLGVATYLTITHYDTHLTLACPKTQTFNCETVTTSAQSHILGIPVAVLGLLYFVPMLVLCLPVAWRSTDRRVHLARLVFASIGVGTIIYLIIAELFLIKAICLWCTSVHLITFIIFVIVVTASPIVLSSGYGVVPAYGVGSDQGA